MVKHLVSPSLDNRTFEDIKLEEEIFKISPEIFNPNRFMILNALLKHGVLDFSDLKNGIHAKSDGHLASHLRALEKAGLIQYSKEFEDRRPRTFYMLTEQGKSEFMKLAKILETSIKGI